MVENLSFSFKKALLIMLYVILGLFIVVVGIGYFGLKPLLIKRIQVAVLNSTDSLYQITFKNIKYDIMAGNAVISDVIWMADTTLYDNLKKNKKMPDNIYQGKVNEIKLSGLRPLTIFLSEKLELSSIVIRNPIIEISHQKQPYNNFKTAKSPYAIISKFVKSFSVNKISFTNINFTYRNAQNNKNEYISKLENLDLEVSNLLINANSHKDTSRFYYTKECIFRLEKLAFPSHDSLNALKINTLLFSTKTHSLSIEHLVYQPRYQPMQYGNHTKGDDRIGIVCKKINFENIDLKKLFEEKKIYAETLTIKQGDISVFTDTRDFKTPPKAIYRPYPHEAFKDLSVKFKVKKVNLKHFNITYSEYNPETNLVGNVYFNHIKGDLLNLTNDTLPLLNNPHCLLSLRAKLMNKADMFVKINFNIAAPKADFTCVGKVLNMNINALNQVIESLAKAKAESGIIEEFSFNMKGDKYGLKGFSTLRYRDLKVTFLKKSADNKLLKERKLLSFIANTFVVKNSNPIRKKPIRIAAINYKRVPRKAFFYTLWKSILEGIKGSVL